ncbi:alpha-D-ribose 1-methylphosphonate 5-triphosphate diphosphatase [Mycolicibacterium mengxianglii]|uniref:alpha-D-ribose 1-methylphosphonate 5-triphosphate diphosphatase n=1 Tax=Mycolicibacterium mengxianglii TaxID=2736649 RepID=UPI0018D13850|nr:alpha-D-ribose 1-methylphosphonate 5-triphosphate diphosphatase [Mycolicibacterium mengxianglii]
MAFSEKIFRNARIVLEDDVVHGVVRVVGGVIADVSAGTSTDVAGEDLDGDFLLPGVVELHTDQVETYYQPRPQRFWAPVPAVIAHDAQMAASGVTTVLDALRIGSGPGDTTISRDAGTLVGAVMHAQNEGLLRAEHFIHLRCEVATPDVLDIFDELGSHERVRLVSLMDHTPGQRQYADIEAFRTYMVGKHRLSPEGFDEHVAQLHTRSAQYSAVNRIELASCARGLGLTLAAHDDATADHVAESSALGVRISEFPTTLEAAAAAREAGQVVMMGAPNVVRGGSHSGNVAAADLLEAGLLDVLSSDYVASSPLQAVFSLVDSGTLTMPEAVALVTANPARAIGLDDRGTIAAGRRADLVRVSVHQAGVAVGVGPIDQVPIVRGVWREGRRVA